MAKVASKTTSQTLTDHLQYEMGGGSLTWQIVYLPGGIVIVCQGYGSVEFRACIAGRLYTRTIERTYGPAWRLRLAKQFWADIVGHARAKRLAVISKNKSAA